MGIEWLFSVLETGLHKQTSSRKQPIHSASSSTILAQSFASVWNVITIVYMSLFHLAWNNQLACIAPEWSPPFPLSPYIVKMKYVQLLIALYD